VDEIADAEETASVAGVDEDSSVSLNTLAFSKILKTASVGK
jgi:hypothetical protein